MERPLNNPTEETPEEIKRAQDKYWQEIGAQADEQNSRRPMLDKATGKNKIDPIDIAHKEALQENQAFDAAQARAQEVQARQEMLREAYEQELAAARAGAWNRDDSRFHFSPGEEQQSWLEALIQMNTEALEQKYLQEQALLKAGTWEPEQSALYVPAYSPTEVNDLKREKHAFFEKLKQQWQERKAAHKEAQEQEMEAEMEQHFTEEKQAINSGTWNETGSYFQVIIDEIKGDQTAPDLNHPELPRYVTAMKKLDELRAHESRVLTETERKQVAEAYAHESTLAEQGNWTEAASYFVTVQAEARFKKFAQELQHKIQEHVSTLGFANMSAHFAKSHGTNTETVTEKEAMMREIHELMGVELGAPPEKIKQARRRFNMKNHPDKKAGDSKAAKKFSRFTELKTELKRLGVSIS